MRFSAAIKSPENILPHRSILVGKDKNGPCSECLIPNGRETPNHVENENTHIPTYMQQV